MSSIEQQTEEQSQNQAEQSQQPNKDIEVIVISDGEEEEDALKTAIQKADVMLSLSAAEDNDDDDNNNEYNDEYNDSEGEEPLFFIDKDGDWWEYNETFGEWEKLGCPKCQSVVCQGLCHFDTDQNVFMFE